MSNTSKRWMQEIEKSLWQYFVLWHFPSRQAGWGIVWRGRRLERFPWWCYWGGTWRYQCSNTGPGSPRKAGWTGQGWVCPGKRGLSAETEWGLSWTRRWRGQSWWRERRWQSRAGADICNQVLDRFVRYRGGGGISHAGDPGHLKIRLNSKPGADISHIVIRNSPLTMRQRATLALNKVASTWPGQLYGFKVIF